MIREPIEVGPARGLRYAELPAGLLERLPAWLASGVVAEGVEVRPRRLYRWEGAAVKLFGAPSRWKARFRAAAAFRCADLHEELAPIATPRPLLALEHAAGSCLVYEWVEGRHLFELWGEDRAAADAFPAFLAAMHAKGVYHGDLHMLNVVWDGSAWYLLDLDGLRHRLRNLRPLAVVEDQWSRILFALSHHRGAEPAAVRPLYDRYVALSGRVRDPEGTWRSVLGRARRHADEAERAGEATEP